MKTITQAKPLEFQVADVCPHCGQVMPVAIASKPPAEVTSAAKSRMLSTCPRSAATQKAGVFISVKCQSLKLPRETNDHPAISRR